MTQPPGTPSGGPVPLPPPTGEPVRLPPPSGEPVLLPPPWGAPTDLPPPSGQASPQRGPVPETAAADEQGWRRLDPKMLLVTPVRTVGQALLPIVIALFGLSRSNDGIPLWAVGAFALVAVLFGVVPWFTTHYRITATQLQVRRGLLNKALLTAPLDRVRSVDLESSVLHRLLGLSKVKVGTGVDETRIELDALSRAAAAELRHYLLVRSRVLPAPARPAGAPDQGAPTPHGQAGAEEPTQPGRALPAPDQELARIDWSWLRYAPFSLGSLVIAAGAIGLFMQFNDDLQVVDPARVEAAWEWALAQALLVLVLGLLVVALVGWVLLSTLNYVVQWWNLRLVRESAGTLRLTRGLFTTRSTTVEESRVRGVKMTEPVLLSLVKGAELATLATGVGSGGTTKVLPPCPRAVAEDVGHTILGESGALTVRLRQHGAAARRRTHVRAQLDLPFLAVGMVALTLWRDLPWWWMGVGLAVVALWNVAWAEVAYRNLGHELTPLHLVSRAGAAQRDRIALERAGVIGWVLRQSYFQRRRGLATLVATTAAGGERVEVADLPLERAVALASATTPGVVGQFLQPTGDAGAGATSAATRHTVP